MKKRINDFLKRTIDILGSISGLLILSPIMLILSMLILLDSKGPVFFLQQRLGKHGKIFKIIKFRTMIKNAENIGDGIMIYSEGDSRITNLGKFMRRFSIDEIPQLINVLIGDMSLVGPRPPIPTFPMKYEEYSKENKKRFSLKPGITGFAQVEVRNSVSWKERFKYDIKYCENYSIFFDFKILLKTIIIIFSKNKIYFNKNNSKEKK